MTTAPLHSPTEAENQASLASFFADQKKFLARARVAEQSLQAATQNLITVLSEPGTGQSTKVANIIWSAWNGSHTVGLGDALSGLDHHIAESVLALLEARLSLGGDADEMIRYILDQSGEMDRFQTSGTNSDSEP